jgi:hypothetical protein
MGHLRLGRLPKTRKWNQVVTLLDSAPGDVAGIARAVVESADSYLTDLNKDPSLGYCFWLLTRVTRAARESDFALRLQELGIHTRDDASVLSFISQLTDIVQSQIARNVQSGPIGELASLAMRRALTETIGEHNLSLFNSSVTDLQRACVAYSTRKQFGVLAKGFFGDFFARALRYFVAKELSNYVGFQHGLNSVEASNEFNHSLDLYTRQSARIIEDFAAGWYSKHNWESKGEISIEEAQGFVAVALRKFRMELKREHDSQ